MSDTERPEPLTISRWDRRARVAAGQLRLRGDVDGLCRVVAEADVLSARHAIALLADLGAESVVDLLLECLGEAELCSEAVEALGRLGAVRAVPALVALLGSLTPDDVTLGVICRALVRIGDPAAVPALVAATSHWRQFLNDRVDVPALEALAAFEPGLVVPGLLVRLWEYAADGRSQVAVRVLGELGDSAAMPALIYLLTVGDGALRRASALAAARLDGPADWRLLGRLLRVLRDPDPWTAQAAAEILTRSAFGRDKLMELAGSDDPLVCKSACHGLGTTGDQRYVPILEDRLRADPSAVVRRAAAHALRRLGGPAAVDALTDALGDRAVGDIAVGALASTSDTPVAKLTELLYSSVEEQAAGAALVLGRIGGADTGDALLVAMDGATGTLRAAIVTALGALRHRNALPLLSRLAVDLDQPAGLRARAVHAAGVCGAEEVVRHALADSEETVRLRAVQAFGGFPGRAAAPALAALATRDSLDVRRAALTSLGQLGQEAAEALFGVLAELDGVALTWAAAELPLCARPEDITRLAALARHPDRAVAHAAVTALASLDTSEVISPLVALLSDPGARAIDADQCAVAVTALGRFDHENVVTVIVGPGMALAPDAARAALTTIANRRNGRER